MAGCWIEEAVCWKIEEETCGVTKRRDEGTCYKRRRDVLQATSQPENTRRSYGHYQKLCDPGGCVTHPLSHEPEETPTGTPLTPNFNILEGVDVRSEWWLIIPAKEVERRRDIVVAEERWKGMWSGWRVGGLMREGWTIRLTRAEEGTSAHEGNSGIRTWWGGRPGRGRSGVRFTSPS